MARKDAASTGRTQVSFANEHCVYADLAKRDRHALRDTLRTAFPIGKSSHQLWSDFPDTTAFVRRITRPADGDPDQGIIGGAIVMSHAEDQYDYLAYIAIHPEYQHRRRLWPGGPEQPHHGTELLRYVFDVMRSRVSPSRMQRYLMIEPAGTMAARFYRRALPPSDYPVRFFEDGRVISVGYDSVIL